MRKGGQKAKGSAHQRRVANLFTPAYYPEGQGLFKSTPGSGGWDKRAAPGDVIAFKYIDEETKELGRDKNFPMVIECKDWKDANVKHFFSGLYSDESQLFDWMEQAMDDALVVKKIPIVVFKLYRTENVVMLMSSTFNKLADLFGNFTGKIYIIEKIMPKGYNKEQEAYQKLVFVLLKDFIQWIDWRVYMLGEEYIRSLPNVRKGKA